MSKFERSQANKLRSRFLEEPSRILFVGGPRQVGKTTLVKDALRDFNPRRYQFFAVDQPIDYEFQLSESSSAITEIATAIKDVKWLSQIWQQARVAAASSEEVYILVIDEIQKIDKWSEAVKGLWDEDRSKGIRLHVVLLGSSPLLMQQGMSESLAGRFELIRVTHWSFIEMNKAFDFSLDEYIYFGGYPGAASLIRDESRWRNYVMESLIRPSIDLDVLKMTRIDKPALLKQLFSLGSAYSGQIVAYDTLRGELRDAGNSTTLANYLEKLGDAGLIVGLNKYASQPLRRRSSPKLNVLNTALMAVESGYKYSEAIADRTYWGRMVESAVGVHLYNDGYPDIEVYYWRESPLEVDFVLKRGNKKIAIEVKSGAKGAVSTGLDEFERQFGAFKKLVVGTGGIPLVDFLTTPVVDWFNE